MKMAEPTGAGMQYSLLRERLLHDLERFRKFTVVLIRNRLARAGLAIIVLFTLISFGAPLLVGPYPTQLQRTPPNLRPSSAHRLRTGWEAFGLLHRLGH